MVPCPIRHVHVQRATTVTEDPPGAQAEPSPWEGAYHVGGRDVNLSEAEWAALFSGGTHPPSPPISFDSLGTISIWICLWSFSCPFRDGLTDEDAPSWLSVLKMFWVVMAS